MLWTDGPRRPKARWWSVRRAQNRKPATYRCPLCGGLPARAQRAHADRARGRLEPPPPRPHRVRARGAPGRPAADPRGMAAHPAARRRGAWPLTRTAHALRAPPAATGRVRRDGARPATRPEPRLLGRRPAAGRRRVGRRRPSGSGFDSVWTAEAYGSDALMPLAWWGAATDADQARHRDRPDLRPHPGRDGDGGDDARPPQRRAGDPRPRGLGAAGRGGLVRPAVRQAAGPDARVHRDPARHLGAPGPGHQRRPALPAAARADGHRARQAAEVEHPPAARGHPDLPRRRGPEEHRAGRRALRRLAGAVLLAPPRRLLPRGAGGGTRPARRPPHAPRSSRWPRPCR